MLIIVGTSTHAVTRSDRSGDELGLERRHDHMRGAKPRDCVRREAIGEVEHRSGVQVAVVLAVAQRDQHVLRIRKHVAVSQHHALRQSRRATGVEDPGKLLASADVVRRVRHDQIVIADHAGRTLAIAAMDQMPDRSASFGE
jgi:hypothetical protein